LAFTLHSGVVHDKKLKWVTKKGMLIGGDEIPRNIDGSGGIRTSCDSTAISMGNYADKIKKEKGNGERREERGKKNVMRTWVYNMMEELLQDGDWFGKMHFGTGNLRLDSSRRRMRQILILYYRRRERICTVA